MADIAVGIEPDEAVDVILEPDGSATISVGEEPVAPPEHDDNLAEHMDESALETLASELWESYQDDLRSRADWEETFKEGLQILGIKLEEVNEPFEGACAAHHPLMLEAALQFQARAISALCPPEGPVKTITLGERTDELSKQAERVKDFMNYQLSEVMEEWFDELDTLLFHLPIAGSAFKKTYYDFSLGRPVSRYVPAEDFVVSYSTTDLNTSPRYTQILKYEDNDVRKLQVSGFYRDIDLTAPTPSESEIQTQKSEISGQSQSVMTTQRKLLEMYVDIDLQGFEAHDDLGAPTGIALPYVVTIDQETTKILSIRRNWREDDALKRRRTWVTHYKFMPGLGFYGFGLVHILGNLQKTATATLRNLIDAGQFANLPAGFKARGMRIGDGGDTPLAFGEFRDVEGYGDDIRKSIIPLPVKEPSQTLFLLLGKVIEDGRRLAAVTDIAATDMNNEAPVGSTLAVMEQGMKVMSAIHKRLHRAQRAEFKILARINGEFLPDQYPYAVKDEYKTVLRQDFDGRVDVIPVSDPTMFSESQKIMRAQTQLQLATQFPQQHDLHEALHRMHEVIGTTDIDKVLLPQRGAKPMDPATELFNIMQSQPVKAYAFQDHNAHLQAHMAQMQLLQGLAMQNPALQQAGPAMLAHVAEHQAWIIRQQMEAMSGIPLNAAPDFDRANPGKDDGYIPMDPQTEQFIAQRQALAAQQLAQQMQAMQQAQQAQDPTMALMQQKLQIDAMKAQATLMKVQNEAKADDADRQEKMVEHNDWYELEKEKLGLAREKMAHEGLLKREDRMMDAQHKAADRLHRHQSEAASRQHQSQQSDAQRQHDAAKTQFTASAKTNAGPSEQQ